MKSTMEILTKLQENSQKNHDEIFTRLYRYLLRPDIYFIAYQHLYSNKGAGTKGVNDDTADGFSEQYVTAIIEALRTGSYEPKPVRRTYIQKKNGKLRPLGLPVFADKLVQEAIRMILEAIYEPIFSIYSHGFRPGKSCHTALAMIKHEFTGAKWFIEGDIKAKLKCTVRDFEEVKQAVDYLKAHSLNTVEDLNQAIESLNQTAAPLRRQLKRNENRMRAIAQIKDAAAIHAKLKPIHDTFLKKNFKLTKDAYASQHKEELDAFNKAVRTMMKLNGSTTVDFSALDAEFSALQSGSAELRSQLETLQPDISALKNIRKYIDMVLNKQQLSAPGGKTPEKESVLKQLEQLQQEKSKHKAITPMNREESL